MLLPVLIVLCFTLSGIATLFSFSLKRRELGKQVLQHEGVSKEREGAYESEMDGTEKIRHIPNVIERERRTEAEIAAKIVEADRRSQGGVDFATAESQEQARKMRAQADGEGTITHDAAQRVEDEAHRSRQHALITFAEACQDARDTVSKACKEATEAHQQVNVALTARWPSPSRFASTRKPARRRSIPSRSPPAARLGTMKR